MNRLLPVAMGCALAAFPVLSGCGDENGDDNRPNPVAVIAVASDVGVVSGVSLQKATLGIAAVPEKAPLPGRFAPKGFFPSRMRSPADTLFPAPLTCPWPEAWHDTTTFADTLSLDYGTGCRSTLDGQLTAGTLLLDIKSNTLGNGLRFLTAFTDYSRNGRTVSDGTVAAEERGIYVDVTAVDLVTTGVTLGGILSASLVAEGPLGSGLPFYCRGWKIGEGSGSVSVGNFDYAFSVLDTLTVSTCCAWPTAGILSVTGDGLVPAFIDFGQGTCDSLATLTIGDESQTITLSY